MKWPISIWLLLISFCSVSDLEAQRFSCDGQLLIGSNDGVSTTIMGPIYIPFAAPFLSPISRYINGRFDALGFNSKDNFIYGVEENSNNIVRLKKDNTFERIGVVSMVDSLQAYAGDCTPEGLYLLHVQALRQILVFDVVDDFNLLQRIDLYWDPSSPNIGVFDTQIYDFAIDPNNPARALAYHGSAEHELLGPLETQGSLLQINLDFNGPNLGMVTPLQTIDANSVSHLGALIFSPQSSLFGYGTEEVGINPVQNNLYSLNPFSEDVSTVLSYNQGSMLSDGCSCPYAFTFSSSVPTEGMYCNNELKTFVLRINNSSFNPVENVILYDTLPQGMVIEEISDDHIGNFTGDGGIGTNYFEISDFAIPAKSQVEIQIKVRSVDAVVGDNFNQAFLKNLPPRFGGDMASDNLGTPGVIGDASKFFVQARRLEDVTWEITQPTDCIDANDGIIVVKSPQFFEGQEFEVKLRNKIGWDELTLQGAIGADNSFTVDSLLPGDYQIFHFRSLSDNCSLALKDTTILLEAPHDQLSLQADSNTPICEGETLELFSAVSPDGGVKWSGPGSFGSESLQPFIEDAETDRSGEYRVTAEYGYCEQIEYLEVEVRPEVNAIVDGDSEYCERSTLQLLASTEDTSIYFCWMGPDGLTSIDSNLIIENLATKHQGIYQVMASNGACHDTVDVEVDILPTPSLQLEDVIITDFCNPVLLTSSVSGGSNVTYQWFPGEGLSCIDCPSPLIEPLIQSDYQLHVENEYQCKDSAAVKIILDESRMLYAPNIFQPNSKGANNLFTIFPGCVIQEILSFEVYDRWGGRVFSAVESMSGSQVISWNGRLNGQMSKTGVYIWSAKVQLVDGSTRILTGDVTLF